jgi:diadenylate cyclase
VINWVDILIVTFLIYQLVLRPLARGSIRGTRTWRIVLGLVSYIVLMLISENVGLKTLTWMLDKGIILGPVALVILFLPEIRQMLESFGKLWPTVGAQRSHAESHTIEELVAAVSELAAEHIGALMVIERTAALDEVIANGVVLNAEVSAALINAIFYEGNPLHDGAAIIRRDSIAAAACRLPLSESSRIDKSLHMRHRAGVGITENSDAIGIIVSEERGAISVAVDGRLRRVATPMDLRDILNRELRGEEKPRPPVRRRRPLIKASKPKSAKSPSEVSGQ